MQIAKATNKVLSLAEIKDNPLRFMFTSVVNKYGVKSYAEAGSGCWILDAGC
jgi:hypothetical protein